MSSRLLIFRGEPLFGPQPGVCPYLTGQQNVRALLARARARGARQDADLRRECDCGAAAFVIDSSPSANRG